MLNFLIVVPRYVSKVGAYYEFPLGLAYISSALKSKGFNVFCLNLNHQSDSVATAIKNAIRQNHIDVVCTGGLSPHYHKIDDILKETKKVSPEIITIIGGGLFGSEPEIMLRSLAADYGVFEEGEETIVELATALENATDPKQVKGIMFVDDHNNIVTTKLRDSIQDLDSIPWPDYEGLGIREFLDMQMPYNSYYLYPFDNPRLMPMISTRSCPFSCTFCYHPIGKVYRKRSLDDFFKELEYLIDSYNINMVSLLDELFSVKKERMLEFCARIKSYNIKWIAQMRVGDIDKETISALKESGCFYISFGLESISSEVLKSMKKKIKSEQIDIALKLTRNANIGIQGNFIFGDLAETEETAQETLDWWKVNIQYQINLGFIIPYPGCENYKYAVKNGLIKDKLAYIKTGCPPINLTKLPQAQYAKLQRKVAYYQDAYRISGKIISQKKIQENESHKEEAYSLTVQCPYCNSISIYKNMPKIYYSIYDRLACRNCNQKFALKGSINLLYLMKERIRNRPELYALIKRVRAVLNK